MLWCSRLWSCGWAQVGAVLSLGPRPKASGQVDQWVDDGDVDHEDNHVDDNHVYDNHVDDSHIYDNHVDDNHVYDNHVNDNHVYEVSPGGLEEW